MAIGFLFYVNYSQRWPSIISEHWLERSLRKQTRTRGNRNVDHTTLGEASTMRTCCISIQSALLLGILLPATMPETVLAFQASERFPEPIHVVSAVDVSRAAPTVGTRTASLTTLDQRLDPVIRTRLILVSQVAMAGIPSIGARGSLGTLGMQPGFDLNRTIDTICPQLNQIYDDSSLPPGLRRQLMLTAARTGMAAALGITEQELIFHRQYTKIAEELVEDVLRTGNCNPAFKGRAREIELAYQQGDLAFSLSVSGFAPAQAPAKVYPSAQAPAAPSKSLPLPVALPPRVPGAPVHP